jgi:hypothetical protein
MRFGVHDRAARGSDEMVDEKMERCISSFLTRFLTKLLLLPSLT